MKIVPHMKTMVLGRAFSDTVNYSNLSVTGYVEMLVKAIARSDQRAQRRRRLRVSYLCRKESFNKMQ